MITDYNYNYFFLNVIDYNYRLHCKVIMITLWLLLITFKWILFYLKTYYKNVILKKGKLTMFLIFFLSFSIYCQTLFRVLSAGVLCTLRVAGWKPTSNHIEITVGFFNLHRGWLSLHRGHPVNVPIRRTMHLSSVIPANDTRESVFGHRNFSRRERESNLGPLAPEASA